jgi:hypothetical protein
VMLVENHVDGPTDEIYADVCKHLPESRFGHTQPPRLVDEVEAHQPAGDVSHPRKQPQDRIRTKTNAGKCYSRGRIHQLCELDKRRTRSKWSIDKRSVGFGFRS